MPSTSVKEMKSDRLADELIHNNFPKDDSSTVAKALSPLMKSPSEKIP
jgi:hypothetical protein